MSADPRFDFTIAAQLFGRAITMPDPGVVRDVDAQWQIVASAQTKTPVPMELALTVSAIDVSNSEGIIPLPYRVGFPVGNSQAFYAGDGGQGAWRITYGNGGHARILICDLASFRLNLGGCTSVRVEAMRWRDASQSAGFTVIADADIQPSTGGPYDEPYYTLLADSAGIPGGIGAPIPPFAQSWTPYFQSGSGWLTSGVWNFTGEAAQVYVDGPNLIQFPQFTRYEIGYTLGAAPNAGYVLIDGTDGTEPDAVGVRFFLST